MQYFRTRSTSRFQVAAASAILLAAAVAGCSDSTPRTGSGSVSSAAPASVGVPDALNFRAPLVGGGEFDGAALAGKPVALWFWAPT